MPTPAPTPAPTSVPTPAPTPGSASLEPSTVADGDQVTVRGNGFAPGTAVDITLHSTPVLLKQVTAGADGAILAVVRVPAGTASGAHQIVLTGIGSAGQAVLRYALDLKVVSLALPQTSTLGTGDGPGPDLPGMGALLVLIGSLIATLFVGSRYRKTASR
jgi:hypothetical protein